MKTINTFLSTKARAEKLWQEGKYTNAASKYYEAASYAMKELRNVLLSKTLLVEHYLCQAAVPGNFNEIRIEQLLKSIDDLLELELDDRLHGRLKPYKIYFESIVSYLRENIDDLERQKSNLLDNSRNKKFSQLETLSLLSLEMGIAKCKLKREELDPSIFSKEMQKLSESLQSIVQYSELPVDVKLRLDDFSKNINKDNNKKPEAFEDVTIHSSDYVSLLLKNLLADMVYGVEFQRRHLKKNRVYQWQLILNYSGIILITSLIGLYLYITDNSMLTIYWGALGVIASTYTLLIKKDRVNKLLSSSKTMLVALCLLSLISLLFVGKAYINSTRLSSQILRITGRSVEFYSSKKNVLIGDKFFILSETLNKQNSFEVGGRKLAIVSVKDILESNERYLGEISHISLGYENLKEIKEGLRLMLVGNEDLSGFLPFGQISSIEGFRYYLNFSDGIQLHRNSVIIVLGESLSAYDTPFSKKVAGRLRILSKELNHFIAVPVDSTEHMLLKKYTYVLEEHEK